MRRAMIGNPRWLSLALVTLAACGAPSQNTDASADAARMDAADTGQVTDDGAIHDGATATDVTALDATVMDATTADAPTVDVSTVDASGSDGGDSAATRDAATVDASVRDGASSDAANDGAASDGGGADVFVPDPACMYVNVDDRVVQCAGRYRFNRRFDTVPASAACPPYWRVGDSPPASTAEQAAMNAGCSTECEFRFMTSVSRLYCGRRSGFDILVGTPARCGTIYSFPEGFFSSVDEHDMMFPCP
jgi:hypothetical protein